MSGLEHLEGAEVKVIADGSMSIAEACALTSQFGRFLKGLARLQEAAAALAGADQLIRERQAQAEALAINIATSATEHDERLAKAQSASAEAVINASAAIADATAKAAEILAAARDEADRILVDARKAEFHANGKVTGANGKANDAERRLKVAQDELATVETRLEQAKAEGRKIFGG